MRNRVADIDRLSDVLVCTRKMANLTQANVAKALGKSIGTIKNWENGFGAPDFPTLLEWLDICNADVEKCLMMIYAPDKYNRTYTPTTDNDTLSAIKGYLDREDSEYLNRLHYSIFSSAAADWHAQLDMMTVFNNLPSIGRIIPIRACLDSYLICNAKSEVDISQIQPCLENLQKGIKKYPV